MSPEFKSSFATDVIPLLGSAVADELVRRLGGTTFPVPKRENAQGQLRYRQLAEVVGVEAADLLVYHYGGSELYIPRGARQIQAARDAAINEEAIRMEAREIEATASERMGWYAPEWDMGAEGEGDSEALWRGNVHFTGTSIADVDHVSGEVSLRHHVHRENDGGGPTEEPEGE